MAVINVSRGGLLLESDVRLRPGSGICLNVVLDGESHRIDGHVLHVDAHIVANKVVYRAGVQFDADVTIFDPPAMPAHDSGPVPAPPIDVVSMPAQSSASEKEAASLRDERDVERRLRDEQSRTIATLREALDSGERLRQELLDDHSVERARWTDEQQELLERVREAEDQAAAMVQDMRAARDSARRTSREHANIVADLEARVRERDQQIAALRAEHAALYETVSRQLDAYDAREAQRQAQHGRLTGQLAATEAWCADQQDLLYQVRQQMASMFALMEGSPAASPRPAALPEPPAAAPPLRLAQGNATSRALPPSGSATRTGT